MKEPVIGYARGVTPRNDEPLDLGATEMSPAEQNRVRAEHDLDRPRVFDERNAVDDRAETRSTLLPEEEHAGSADPEAQAREVLRDSDLRTEVPESAPDTMIERRRPEDTA
ncbi:hypothetical protein [Amycolatopsis thermalba]|uniref:hypothetical protein n=1 Tax=Amycolatopsis thermalba TaxID=944492 RepID=UPI001F076B5B|nr:hypothetical protein [Amycolatopsis thermalba]